MDSSQRLLDLALKGVDEETRADLLQLAQEYGIESDDPLFVLFAITGKFHSLAQEFPERVEAAIAQLNEGLEARTGTIDAYGNTLEQKYKAVFIDAVQVAVKKLDGGGSAPPWKGWVAGAMLLLLGAAVGAGTAWKFAEPVTARELVAQLDPAGPRQLTLEEAEALEWVRSPRGQRARELWELNKGNIEVCENNKKKLGGKCAIVVDPDFVER